MHRRLPDPALGREGVGLAEKVAALGRPDIYPDHPRQVQAVETHMSWVFLTDRVVYKLKKPVRVDGVSFDSLDARRRNCEEEVRLNRRLAPDVYLGLSSLTRGPGQTLLLDGQGVVVDWLVRMRRLEAERTLEALIANGDTTREEAAIRGTARYLARFYRAAPREPTSGPAYRARLLAGVREDLEELSQPRFGLPQDRLEALVRGQLAFLEQRADLFDARAEQGRIVEGHGDLRPEHIFVIGPEPAIIDCLEFDRDLRLLDPIDELAFLQLECDRLGDARVGRWFLEAYRQVTGDDSPAPLLAFHRVYRALRRATLAARHLDDPSVRDPDRFQQRARRYLEMVEESPGARTSG